MQKTSTVKIVIHFDPSKGGVNVTTIPSFERLAAKAERKTMSPAEAYAWIAMKAIRNQSAAVAAANANSTTAIQEGETDVPNFSSYDRR